MTTGAQSQLLGSMQDVLTSIASSPPLSPVVHIPLTLDVYSASDMLLTAGAVLAMQDSSEVDRVEGVVSTINQVHKASASVVHQLLKPAVPNALPVVIENDRMTVTALRAETNFVVGREHELHVPPEPEVPPQEKLSRLPVLEIPPVSKVKKVKVRYPSTFEAAAREERVRDAVHTHIDAIALPVVPETVDTYILVFPDNTYPTSGAFSSAASSVSSLVSIDMLPFGSIEPLSISGLVNPFKITLPLEFSEEQSSQTRSIQLLLEIDQQKVSASSLNSTWSQIQSSLAIKACNAPGTGATAPPALEMAMGCPNVTRLSTSQYTNATLGRSVWALTVRLEYQYEPVLDGWFERVVNSQESLWSSMGVVKVVPDTTNSGGAYRPRCQYWDEVSSGWSTKGMTSTVDYTALDITCETTHLSSFGAVTQWNSVGCKCAFFLAHMRTCTCTHAH